MTTPSTAFAKFSNARSDQTRPSDSLTQIIRKIPRHCFEKQPVRAWSSLARDAVAAILLVAAIAWLDSWIMALPASLLLGCVLTGVFVIGHDAGHRSFSDSKRVNDFVGHVATSLTLWPFHVWRLSHEVHHRWTHHAEKEIAWRPLTVDEFEALPRWKQSGYLYTRTSLFFWASILFQGFMIVDALRGRFFDAKDRALVRRSLLITVVVASAYAFGTIWLAGWYGFVFLFVVPQLVYQFWLSSFTLLHHTAPDRELMAAEEWSAENAQLASSIHVVYPKAVDWLTHDIAWHVPHHVCVAIPHYHLRAAHRALKATYPEVVTEQALSWPYVKRILAHCHLIGSIAPGGQKWLSVDRRAVLVRGKAVS